MRKGHVIKGSKLIDKMVSERHPHTDKEFIYSVTLRECTCGLIFTSVGLAFRDPPWEPEKIGEISD